MFSLQSSRNSVATPFWYWEINICEGQLRQRIRKSDARRVESICYLSYVSLFFFSTINGQSNATLFSFTQTFTFFFFFFKVEIVKHS